MLSSSCSETKDQKGVQDMKSSPPKQLVASITLFKDYLECWRTKTPLAFLSQTFPAMGAAERGGHVPSVPLGLFVLACTERSSECAVPEAPIIPVTSRMACLGSPAVTDLQLHQLLSCKLLPQLVHASTGRSFSKQIGT